MSDPRNDASDEEEEDFNPAQEVASDAGAEANGGDAGDEVGRPQRDIDDELAGDDDEDDAPQDRARDDDDEEDEDDEDDEEEAVTSRPRKRRRRDRMNQFIEMEAEVDEDEDDEIDDDEEGAEKGFIQEDVEAGDDLPPGADADDRIHRMIDRRREQKDEANAEELAKRFQQQYGRRDRAVGQENSIVPREFLMPSVDDPKIYGVSCKIGKERDVVFSILKRVEERANSRSPLKIFSAVERGGSMQGYVYVEARRQADVLEAVDGVMFAYPHSSKGLILLPVKEMPDILRVKPTETLQTGQYVRIKRGLYQGDVAQVDLVSPNALGVFLKIVPRLHYGIDEDMTTASDGKRKRGAGSGPRPPPRHFSDVEAKKKFPMELSVEGDKTFRYFGEEYVQGFLVKEMKLQHLQVEGVHPNLEEVARFSVNSKDGAENLDLSALAASIKNNTSGDDYQAGDIVEVYEGEQSGIYGKVLGVRRDIVNLQVSDGDLKGQRIDVPAKSLRKRFREGDHVKVIGSSHYRDEVGMVVGINGNKVTFVSDMSMTEITVFSKDLRVAQDSGATGSLGQYNLHDLVQLDSSTVGCIVKIERESMRVLDQFDTVRNVMPSQIANKIEKRKNAVATDRAGNEIRLEDTVKEVEGERRTGVILHIHRSFVFLMNREFRDNSGIFVTRATNVATVAAKGGRQTNQAGSGPDLSRMNPALQRGAPGQNGMLPPPRSFGGRDPVIGKTVKIARGNYKGLLGIVRDANDKEARVELHTKNKVIPVDKTFLRIQESNGDSVPYTDFVSRRGGRGGSMGGGFGGRPSNSNGFGGPGGGRTPMAAGNGDGGRTPGWGSVPARTPAWAGSGGATPGWGASAGGGRTPAWSKGAGGRTPAGGGWGGGQTAYGGGGMTAYGGSTAYGGATYDNSGGKTPAPGASYDAPTPGAPTPGAPTPGASYDAPTPYAGGGATKWGGEDDDDDGPRYAD